MKRKKYPHVLLVGRMNVGKSTLFNRLTRSTKSIVFDHEGVTRDYLHEVVEWQGMRIELFDTGGLQMTKVKDELTGLVKERVFGLADTADLFLFVCDVKNGMVPEDRLIASYLHKTGKPVILILNKADNTNAYKENHGEFLSLGFSKMLPISSTHGTGITTLFEEIAPLIENVSLPAAEEKPLYNIALVGKPNVGKSSLMNALLKEDRSLVSSIPGTTREALTEELAFHKATIELTDTAGMRKKSRVDEPLESLMVKSSLAAVRTADIVVLLVDASYGRLSDQELKLMFYAYEEKKSLVIVFNKSDLLTDDLTESLKSSIDEYEFFFKKIPHIFISCATKKNVGAVFREVMHIWERQHQVINSTELNEMIQEYIERKPMFHKTTRLKVFKIRHVKAPTPTFVLHVNFPEWFGESQLGFIENIIRKHYDFKGCHISLITRGISSRRSTPSKNQLS